MFYSQRAHKIERNSSHLHTRQVFTGQYWDEFALTGHLVPENGKVLLLGLAMGGGIRPILSANKNIELTCVDLSSSGIEECRNYFAAHFPEIRFSTACSDAHLYLSTHSKKFDAIWLDIYLAESYAPLVFDPAFHQLLRSRLNPGGVVLVNAYGIPNHFSPMKGNTVQAALASLLKKTFPFVGAIPYRRNITFLASLEAPVLHPASPHPELSGLDKHSFRVQRSYLQHLRSCETNNTRLDLKRIQMQVIDQEMRDSWKIVIEGLRCSGEILNQPSDLIELIQSKERGRAVLDKNLHNYQAWLGFFPIFCAGESNLRELKVEWLFDWFIENAEGLRSADSEAFLQVWLKQLWALAINPDKGYRHYAFSLLNLVPKELL